MAKKHSAERDDDQPSKQSGLWRAVLEALESNIKTARLIFILLALALLASAVRPRG